VLVMARIDGGGKALCQPTSLLYMELAASFRW
jgi:hypothetical protein